jgi:serine/threonine protein kinase
MNASVYCAHCGALNQPQAVTCFACSRSLDEPAPAATDARRLIHGRYRLVRQLGVGGFGAVYQAEDTTLGNRLVALKEMSPRGLSPEEAKEATEAFQREALLLAGLAHPSLPRIYERFEEEGRWYLVMDFIEGETLEVYLDKQGGTLPVKEALGLALQLTEVLSYLHSRQPPIIFRDLKPSNIIRAPDGQVFLVDFGIARFFKPGQSKDTIAFGSPGYAAPEQYGKAQTTPRSDIFSLGAVLHQMLTGIDPSEKPFRFAPLTIPRPAGLSGLIERMVEMDESKRPPSMEVIKRELEVLLDEHTPWSADDSALRAALLSSVGTAIGARAATGPVTQPAGYSGPPIQPLQGSAAPQPTQKKKGKAGCLVGLAVAAFLIWQIVSGVTSHSTATNYTTNTDSTSYTPVDQPTTSSTGGIVTNAPSTPTWVYTLAWSPSGDRIASAGGAPNFQVWNVADGQRILNVTTAGYIVYGLVWSPDGSHIVTIDERSDVQIWDATTGAPSRTYKESPLDVHVIAWSADSTRLALGCTDGSVRIINASDGVNPVVYRGHAQQVNAVAWSPDGKYVASGGNDGTVQVWDSATGKPVYTYQGHNSAINSIAWSPDGKRIASADSSSRVETWDALTGQNLLSYNGAFSGANAVSWSPDGSYLAAGDGANKVQVWASDKTTPVYTYNKHTGPVRSLAWSLDSKRIASGAEDGTVQIWDALTGVTVVTYYQS